MINYQIFNSSKFNREFTFQPLLLKIQISRKYISIYSEPEKNNNIKYLSRIKKFKKKFPK